MITLNKQILIEGLPQEIDKNSDNLIKIKINEDWVIQELQNFNIRLKHQCRIHYEYMYNNSLINMHKRDFCCLGCGTRMPDESLDLIKNLTAMWALTTKTNGVIL